MSYPSHTEAIATQCALSDSNTRLRFSDLRRHIARIRTLLHTEGFSAGQRVAILSQNSIALVLLLEALNELGVSVALLNTRLTTHDWKQHCDAANATALFFDSAHESHTIPNITQHPIEALLSRAQKLAIDTSEQDSTGVAYESNREAVVIFTSGSSGIAKGVRLSLGNLEQSARASNEITRLSSGDCWLISLPMYHLAGLGALMRCLYAGAQAHIISSFDDQQLQESLEQESITHLSLVPTQLAALIERCDPAILATLKSIILAGAPSSERLLADIQRLKLPVLSAYGMTETTAHCCCMGLDDPLSRITTVGKPFSNTQIEVVNDHHTPLPAHSIGEIRFSGPTICLGYLDESHALAQRDGWLYSGDLGSFDDEGYLSIRGRKDDMFISGGENIHPAEIEHAALLFDRAKDAAVIAVDDETWGSRPVLFIRFRDTHNNCDETTRQLKEHLQKNLAKFKVPREIIAVSELPKTAIGKTDYHTLRQHYFQSDHRES